MLVQVAAAGIVYSDVQLRAGALKDWMPGPPLPFAVGHEIVGTVAGTGRRVLAQLPAGGYAELAAVPEAALVPLPYGNIGGEPHEIDTATVYRPALSVLGFATALMPPESIAPLRERAFGLAAAGDLRPIVGSVLPLADAAAAHRAFEEGSTTGKTVLVP